MVADPGDDLRSHALTSGFAGPPVSPGGFVTGFELVRV
jgi:hypothetical protein